MKGVQCRPRYETRLVVDPKLLDRLEAVRNNEPLDQVNHNAFADCVKWLTLLPSRI